MWKESERSDLSETWWESERLTYRKGHHSLRKGKQHGVLQKAYLGSFLEGSVIKTSTQIREPQPFRKYHVSER